MTYLGEQLLAAVDVVRRPGQSGVAHDVDGQRRDVGRSDHPPDRERGAQLAAPLFQPIAEQRGRQGRVDEAGGDHVDAHRRDLERQGGGQGAECRCHRRDDAEADPRATAPGPAHEQQRASAADLAAGGLARDAEHRQGTACERAARLVEVHVGERRIVGAAGGHHDVVDRACEVLEEVVDRIRIAGVERRGARRSQLACRALEPFGVAAGQDDLGPLGSCAPGRLEPDAGAAADHDDRLPEQLRLAPALRDARHRVSFRQLAMGGPERTALPAAAMFARSAFNAAT